MARDTSIETFQRIERDGLLSGAQFRVYEALFRHGPCTASELSQRHKLGGGWKRLSELKRRGCAAEVGFKTCTITSSHALVWDVTSKLPEPLAVVETSKDKIRRLERTVRRQDRKLEIFREMIRQMHEAAKPATTAIIVQAKLRMASEDLGE